MNKSKVAIVRCESYDEQKVYEAIKRGVDLIGGIGSFVKKGENILLKSNILAAAKPEDLVTTHPSVFNGIVRLLMEYGVNVTYGDSPGFEKPSAALTKAGLTEIAGRYSIKLGDFEKGRSIDYPQGMAAVKFDIANACLETDGIISLPKMKTHALTRITGAIKNQFGCVYGMNKAAFHVKVPHPLNFAKMLVDLNKNLKMRLFIMDGIVAMDGNGPRAGDAVKMNCIMVSADPIAMDATFAGMIDMNPEYVPTNVYGSQAGLGTYKEEEIELLGDPIDLFINKNFNVVRKPVEKTYQRNLVPKFIGNFIFPRPFIIKENCIKCGICVDACPVEGKALDFKNGDKKQPPVYNYNKCIRCYCCQEICPQKAIVVRKGLF